MLYHLFLAFVFCSNVFVPFLQIRERILQCVMVTSLRLAAKVNEEEEVGIHCSLVWAAFEVEEC